MKQTIAILTFLLNCIFIEKLEAQIPKSAISIEDTKFDSVYSNSPTIPFIIGKIINISKEEINSLHIVYTWVTPFSGGQVKKIAKLDGNGSFKLLLDYPFPYQEIFLDIGDNFYTSLTINKGLKINIDWKVIKEAKEFNFNGKGLQFLGPDGALNNYLNNYIIYNISEQRKHQKSLYDLLFARPRKQGDFLSAYNLIYDSIKIFQEKYIAENPSDFGWILENERMSEYYGKICMMYRGQLMDSTIWKQIQKHKSYLTTNSGTDFYRYMAHYIFSHPTKKASFYYWKDLVGTTDLNKNELDAIDSLKNQEELEKKGYPDKNDSISKIKKGIWLSVLIPKLGKHVVIKETGKSIHWLDSLFEPAKADFMKLLLNTSKDLSEQKIIIEKAVASMHTKWTKAVFLNEYNLASEKVVSVNKTLEESAKSSSKSDIAISETQTNFGAKLFVVKSISAVDFLSSLKKRYRDTAIVLDIWATWCGPCLIEMPYSKKLQQEIKDQPVVFVYLCTSYGSSEQQWEYKIAEIKQPGQHYFIDAKLDAELHKLFSWSGYPGYAFINRKGVYQPGAFDRPSNLKLSKLVELINQK
jgi:thiol-disulfide isomerase/thioredoxin